MMLCLSVNFIFIGLFRLLRIIHEFTLLKKNTFLKYFVGISIYFFFNFSSTFLYIPFLILITFACSKSQKKKNPIIIKAPDGNLLKLT